MQGLLESLGRWTIRKARTVLAVAAALTAIAGVAATGLGIDTDMANMLPSTNPVANSYTEIVNEFNTTSILVAVIEGSNRDVLVAAAEEFGTRLRGDERTAGLVASISLRVDRDFALRWGLMLEEADDIADTGRTLASTRLLPLLAATNDLIEEKLSDGSNEEVEGSDGEYGSYELMSRFGLFSDRLRRAFEAEESEPGNIGGVADALADAWILGEEYFIDPEGKTLLATIRPSFALGDRAKLSALSDGAGAIAEELRATHPGVSISFTGDVESEAEENRAIGSDTFYPSLIAVALIGALFWFSFSRRRSILFALAALLAGIVADLGFAALTVKDLNMITSSFGVLLVGLGIDFGIHIASRYDEESFAGASPELAMGRVFASVGSPIIVGGMTTAVAFYSLLLSRTLAFRQFGLVAGTGMLTTLAAAFLVLPALIGTFPGKDRNGGNGRRLPFAWPVRVAMAARAHRVPVLLGAAALTALAMLGVPRNSFEYDMRKIGPRDTESQAAEALVAERFGVSTWLHMATATSLEEARALHERFEDAPLVRRVESLADYLPPEREQAARLAALAVVAGQPDRLTGPAWDGAALEQFLYEIQRLEWNMIELGDLAAASLGEGSLPVRKRDAMIRQVLGAETGRPGAETFGRLIVAVEATAPEEAVRRLDSLDRSFAAALDARVSALAAADRPMTLDDIPTDARADFVSASGDRYLVTIQGNTDLDGDADIIRLADGLRAIEPTTTGTLSLGLELSREILVESRRAALFVAVLVVAILIAGLRSIKQALAVVIAFAAAVAWTFGVHPLLGKFNIVNAIALPLIIGIGIDYCVHVMSALSSGTDPDGELRKTGKAVTLSASTTIIGFGSLALIGRFEGIAALGRTLTVGIFFCYVTSIVLVPALAARRATFEREASK